MFKGSYVFIIYELVGLRIRWAVNKKPSIKIYSKPIWVRKSRAMTTGTTNLISSRMTG